MATHPNTPSKTALPQDDEEGPRKRHKANTPDFSQADEVVTFLVGPETETQKPKTFIVHKEIACYHSPVLNAAFKSGFIDGRTQTYKLDDVSEGAFKLLVQWLYSQKFAIQTSPADTRDELAHISLDLVMLWVLADKLGIPSLQNLALERINDLSDESSTIPNDCLHYVYNNSSKDSQLRRFFTEMVGGQSEAEYFSPEEEHNIPRQMLLDLVIWSIQLRADTVSIKVSEFFVPVEVDGR
ncbi:hypothetical protein LARI1_G005895 [Lachnellula arida]|uniref:BTB domain-containing protein n=1 Tax=Lachnellula arida TaxID=1316785 RepID=A0A8T9BCD9_9HELO|nr:hypothetical protein LARI1_G005895 [Lachnellula arida]